VSADYFLEIESHFAARRGTPFVLSAKDWALMQKWAADGIPLPVVIEAIDSVFDKAAERNKIVNSLSYCRHAVKEIWKERQALQVGGDAATPEAEVETLLDALAASLSPPFAERVRALVAEKSVPRIEERLIELEQEMIGSLVTEDIRAEAASAVGGALDDATRARTEEAYVRRLVREKHALPRLTLFR
jgi:hypothetical protein